MKKNQAYVIIVVLLFIIGLLSIVVVSVRRDRSIKNNQQSSTQVTEENSEPEPTEEVEEKVVEPILVEIADGADKNKIIQLEFDNNSETLRILGEGDIYIGAIYIPNEDVNFRDVKHVIFEEGITSINKEFFKQVINASTVVFSDGFTTIEEKQFMGCHNLESVTIPNTVTTIGSAAFFRCDAIESIIIPNSVKFIGHQAFQYCSGLKEIEIPDSVEEIEYRAFAGCRNLQKVIIADSVTTMGQLVFENDKALKTVIASDRVKNLRDDAFEGCDSLVDSQGDMVQSEVASTSVAGMTTGLYYGNDDCVNKLENTKIENAMLYLGVGPDSWMKASDYSEDLFPHVKRGEKIYGKNISSWRINTAVVSSSNSTYRFQPGTYWGYVYDYIYNPLIPMGNGFTERGDPYFYKLVPGEKNSFRNPLDINDIKYVNDEEIDGKSYFQKKYTNGSSAYSLAYNSSIEKDSSLSVGYFEGTDYHETQFTANIWYICAPREVMSEQDISLSKEGYAYITIPDNFAEGYYCLWYTEDNKRVQYWFYVE